MEKCFEWGRTMQVIFIIFMLLFAATKAFAFWPCDWIPHPEIPYEEPTKTRDADVREK